MNKEQSRAPAGQDGPPSDLELMAYFDGELEGPRRAVVEAHLGADLRARGKVAGMQITSSILREQAASLSAADGIADSVMARIAAEAARAPVSPMYGAAPVAPLPPLRVPVAAPANDNSRRLFGVLGALAVAAAAAFAVWTRAGAPVTEPVRSGPVAAITAPSTNPSPAANEPEIDAAALATDAETEHGVEVAAVNFGAHMGSIFYVPSGSVEAKRVTTVVWLADDAGE
ncbi:MAG: hypothetical protein U0441_04240 [Polyangiaceae bacterium]